MKVAVLGGGNMGGAIAAGMVRSRIVHPADIIVTYPSPWFAEMNCRENLGICTSENNPAAVSLSDLVIIAVKPWMLEEVLKEIAGVTQSGKHAIASVVAGVSCRQILELAEMVHSTEKLPVYRIVPNTAVALGESVTFIAGMNICEIFDQFLEKAFAMLGEVYWIDEENVTAATAVASSGIAYAMRYLEAASSGAEELGLKPTQVLDIVCGTMRGALALLEKNGSTPGMEIDKVTTPGGITLKGLEEMERCGFTEAVINGLKATR